MDQEGELSTSKERERQTENQRDGESGREMQRQIKRGSEQLTNKERLKPDRSIVK